MQLSKELGITQKSAWFMEHHIREGCKRDDFMLTGTVEVAEAYFGWKEANKQAVVGIRQRGGNAIAMLVT